MTDSTEANQPAVPYEMPWLSIFEVRQALAPHTNIDAYDRSIDHLVARAAETGSLDELQRKLHSWLGAALVAQHPEGLVGLDIHGRSRYIEHLLETWLDQRQPDLWRRPPSAGSTDETQDRLQWAVRITSKGRAAVSRPYGTRQAAEDHIARIHAAGSEGDAHRRKVELVWRRMHPWATGEPGPCDLS